MREGRELVRETSRFAVEQRGRSWWHLASTVLVFGAAIWTASMDLPLIIRLAASVVVALVNVRLFVLYHDHEHRTILQGSKVAGVFFRIYGLLTLAPSSIWRHTHDHHHRNNLRRMGLDSVGSFPIMSTEAYREAGAGVRFFYAFSRNPVTIAFGYVTVFLYGFCIQPLLRDPRRHYDAALAILVHGALIAGLAMIGLDVLVFALLLPWFLGSALGSYLFYAQHNFPGVKLRPGGEWDYVFAALRSSSFIRMSPVMHWFTGNIGYHHVHHLNAHIPFYRLPEAMAEIDGLQSPTTTTLTPGAIMRCLRLKLWDPEKDRLVSFREARRRAPAPVRESS